MLIDRAVAVILIHRLESFAAEPVSARRGDQKENRRRSKQPFPETVEDQQIAAFGRRRSEIDGFAIQADRRASTQ